MSVRASSAGVPVWLWLWAAPGIIVAQVGAKLAGESVYRQWMRGELGLVENLTVAFLLGAILSCLVCFRRRARVRWRLFGPAVLVFAAGLVFFAGEEASWGQHWFGFEPPESVVARNDQGEFNLHNDPFFEKLLDQLPRSLLTLAALIGGVLMPLKRRGKSVRDFASPAPWGWVWPTSECFPAALLAVTITLPKKLFGAFDSAVPYALEISPGETKEYCLALFLFVYTLSLARALGRAPALNVP
jgi:hypothetical protein